MDYQRDRNLSYIAFIERINGPTCAERDREFSLLLRETCTLWDDADTTVPISPGRANNAIPSPFTSSTSSFSDDEPEPNPENDSDSDDPDPAEQFLKGVQEHHVVVNGKSYCQEALPLQMNQEPVILPSFTAPQPTPVQHFDGQFSFNSSPDIFTNPFAKPALNLDGVAPVAPPSSLPAPMSPTSRYLPEPPISPRTKRPQTAANRDEEAHSTEDEYRPSPSPPPQPYKRRRATPSNPSKSRSAPKNAKARNRNLTRRQNGQSPQQPSRNLQSTNPWIERLYANDPEAVSWLESCNFVCTECGWVQHSRRMPDFSRHVITHRRPPAGDTSCGWWCKGVLVEQRHLYPQIPEDAPVYEFRGRKRVGGCLKTFSRRDALSRHLDNVNVGCVGKACAVDQE